jgi:glycosyltransferase involved in cell wall biosynthesis
LVSVSAAASVFYKYIKLYEANLQNDLKCSLIVTTYNRPDALIKTLNSVLTQVIPPDEIIVADDGSGEETKKVIAEFTKNSFIPLVHSQQDDKGFRLARSRNIAIAKSKFDYIIVVDGDMVLHKFFVKDHLQCAKVGRYIQGSRVLLNEKQTQKYLQSKTNKLNVGFFTPGIKNRLNGIYAPAISKIYCKKNSREHNGIRGCNFSLFKSDIIKINGFNEDFNSWGREDSEFVERLFNAGIKRQNLKFRGIQYHLYHPEGKAESKNDSLLHKAIEEHLKWCKNGIEQHLKRS